METDSHSAHSAEPLLGVIEIQADTLERGRPPSLCSSHNEPHFGNADIIRDVIVGFEILLT
jgi:hypothetical protein